MARNGVWELKNILLRYCATSGSSRGVREFVEKDLLKFAEKNPQIQFKTKIQGGHPCVYGTYVTGYERQRGLKNMSPEQIREIFQVLRDSLGRKTPTHNEVGIGVVEQKQVSVQGVWRNTPDLRTSELPETKRKREELLENYGMQHIIEELGTAGAVRITQKLLERRAEEHEQALRAIPKVERVLPTE